MKRLGVYLLSTAAILGAGTAMADDPVRDFLSRAGSEIRQSIADANDAGWRNEARGPDRDDDDDDDRDDDGGDDDGGNDDGGNDDDGGDDDGGDDGNDH